METRYRGVETDTMTGRVWYTRTHNTWVGASVAALHASIRRHGYSDRYAIGVEIDNGDGWRTDN